MSSGEQDFSGNDPWDMGQNDFNVDLLSTDIRINPSFYFHLSMVKSIEALTKDDMNHGFLQYRQLAEHLEKLVSGAGLLPNDYKERVKALIEEKEKEDKTDDESKLARHVRIAVVKHGLLSEIIFDNKMAIGKLKTKKH